MKFHRNLFFTMVLIHLMSQVLAAPSSRSSRSTQRSTARRGPPVIMRLFNHWNRYAKVYATTFPEQSTAEQLLLSLKDWLPRANMIHFYDYCENKLIQKYDEHVASRTRRPFDEDAISPRIAYDGVLYAVNKGYSDLRTLFQRDDDSVSVATIDNNSGSKPLVIQLIGQREKELFDTVENSLAMELKAKHDIIVEYLQGQVLRPFQFP